MRLEIRLSGIDKEANNKSHRFNKNKIVVYLKFIHTNKFSSLCPVTGTICITDRQTVEIGRCVRSI